MLVYSIMGFLTFLFQIYLRCKTKKAINWPSSFTEYLIITTMLAIIWPLTIMLISVGVIIGFGKRG